jgi:putative exporter of polyketide antibiotics
VLRYADLGLLALALPVFVIAGWPLLGYLVAAGAWLLQHAVLFAADRRASRALREGDRRTALGVVAAATLGRVWLVALAILLVGLSEREAGLAAAVLTVGLVTLHLGGLFVARALDPEHEGGR